MAGGPAAGAETVDPHALYERRCSRCHPPHAGEFAADSLRSLGGRVVGRKTGQELRAFLAGGHGRLAPREVDEMVAHLASIVQAGGLFREHCLICHGRAVGFARGQLIVKEGRLVGRYSGRDVETFLASHGRLEEAEVGTIVRMLESQLTTQVAR
jgi:mono/diheme cytochrome c family protein